MFSNNVVQPSILVTLIIDSTGVPRNSESTYQHATAVPLCNKLISHCCGGVLSCRVPRKVGLPALHPYTVRFEVVIHLFVV